MYEYRPFVNPYAAAIPELLERRGDIAAHAALASGQIWGGFAHDVGQTIAQLPQQIQQQHRQQTLDEMGALKLKEAKDAIAERDAFKATLRDTPMIKENGLDIYDLPTLTQKSAARGIDPSVYIKPLSELNDTFRSFNASRQAVIVEGAKKVAAAGNDPDLATHFLDTVETNGVYPKEQVQQFRDLIKQGGQPAVAKITAYLMGPQKGEVVPAGASVLNPVTQQPTFTAPEKKPDYTINGQRFSGATGEPIGATQPKQYEPPKPGTAEDWVARARRLAVNANDGKPLGDAQLQAVDAKALQEFKESNADPELRAAALAQKNIAATLAKMQMDQMPTKEQAASVADDLVHHRIAPEQLATLFSTRGKEGLAFKLNVTAEAKKLDPTFNFEEASATYALTKSTGFQNTVRYMDSALESIPRLEQNAQKLGNGSFRTLTQLANAAKSQFNATDLKAFKTDALLVGDEIAKILSGGGTGSATSDAKLKQATDLINASDSVPAIATAMEEVKALMGNRRRALTRGTYMEGTGAVPSDTSAPRDGTTKTVNGETLTWRTVGGRTGWYR